MSFRETPPWSWTSGVKWAEEFSNYVVISINVFRRMLSGAAQAYMSGGEEAMGAYFEAHPEGDHIVKTLISYTLRSWPVIPFTVNVPADPPFDIDPSELRDFLSGSLIIGAPALPGESTFGAGVICSPRTGLWTPNVNASNAQDKNVPGIRGVGSPGGTPPSLPDPPPPPSFGDVTNDWGSPIIQFELYKVNLESGGDALASFSLDFSGVHIALHDTTFQCISAAVIPKEEGAVLHDPPFTGPPLRANDGLNAVSVQILCERQP